MHELDPGFGPGTERFTRRSGSCTGSDRSMISLNIEKMAAFAPIPRASDTIATAVTNGVLRNSVRSAYLTLIIGCFSRR